MSLPSSIAARLRLPLIAAPMLRVSGPDLVSAACRSGVIGSFPTVNARSADELDAWLTRIAAECAAGDRPAAPVCPNIIMRRQADMLAEDVRVLVKHKVEMVIASVGSPEAVVQPLHDVGCLVFADVASVRHAEKALAVGADGLVLLSAGAGGQTGWVNGMSFARAVRAMFGGPIVLSGGISDGEALWAARVLGCDLGMMGTRFIATPESMAVDRYKQMLVDSRLDDVMLTRAFTGLDTNMLRPSVVAAGLDPQLLAGPVTPERARELFSEHGKEASGPKRWVDIWSAGHTVSAIGAVQPVATLVDGLEREYLQARRATAELLAA
ncbi:nitronate monooxygenase family protein [Pseudorhodoferax sp. Leaf274]|uniref:NAD(P)H-dependent flavin oxidoreductase n=1 Tax=Pseudorhodoferax sp. Leaf274 TaxID=1736318 RepID=UPI000702E3C9|nr:nitronate monooxygenase [Pseudorhodoferax sp. Leaf274]KQP39889.1 2-nitropropane dioxygenase [Pseudorhodoferax sp. Leaf274]